MSECPSGPTHLRIGYLNVAGLTGPKWSYLLDQLSTPVTKQTSDSSPSLLPSSHSLPPPSSSLSPDLISPSCLQDRDQDLGVFSDAIPPNLHPDPIQSQHQYDLIFVAEHWFTYAYRRYALKHPYVLLASPLAKQQDRTRSGGGLLLLLSPALKEYVVSTSRTPYSLTVTLSIPYRGDLDQIQHHPLTISGVYLPPSMPTDKVKDELNVIRGSQLILGDVNIQYAAEPWCQQNITASAKERSKTMDAFCTGKFMTHMVPERSSCRSRNDHAYLQMPRIRNLVDKVLLHHHEPPEGMTDFHCWIDVCYSFKSQGVMRRALVEPDPTLVKRFKTHFLNHPLTSQVMAEYYERQFGSQVDFRRNCLVCINHPALSGREDLDALDRQLVDQIYHVCERYLGSYVASDPQPMHGNGNLDERLEDPQEENRLPTSTDTIKAYKRSFKTRRTNQWVESRMPELSALEDTMSFFEMLYASDQSSEAPLVPMSVPTDDHSCAFTAFLSHDRVKKVIDRYPLNKSCGIDGIHSSILQSLSEAPSFLHHLTMLFKACAALGKTPLRWNESLIYPIPKQPGGSQTIADLRPISLTVMFRRIFECLMMDFINLDCPELTRFHPSQAGFRRQFSTMTQLMASHQMSQMGYHFHLFLDLKNAYDRVPIGRLLDKLKARSPPLGLLSLIDSLFMETQSRCVINDQLSTPFKRNRGVFQGSILSPWLFNVFIDDLACELNRIVVDPEDRLDVPLPNALFFADDIELLARSGRHLVPLMEAVHRWMSQNGMEINMAKSALVCDPESVGCYHSPPDQILADCRLDCPVQSSYKYLGIPHGTYGLHLETLIDANIEKATKILNSCRQNSSLDALPEVGRLIIYKTFIRPRVEYGAALVAQWLNSLAGEPVDRAAIHAFPRKKKRKKVDMERAKLATTLWSRLEAFQDKCLAWIFSSRVYPTILRSVSGLGCLRDRFQELACRFTYHLDGMSPDNPCRLLASLIDQSRPPSLLRYCLYHPLRVALEDIPLANGLPQRDRMLRLFASLRLEKLNNRLLPRRISFESRKPSSYIDRVLLIPSRDLRLMALRWRFSTFGLQHTCLPCGATYSSSHITTCALIPVSVPDMDTLLNTGQFDQFSVYASLLLSKISRRRSPPL